MASEDYYQLPYSVPRNYRNYLEPKTGTIENWNFSHTSDLFEEAVIVPFGTAQIEEYVELFTQVQDPIWTTK